MIDEYAFSHSLESVKILSDRRIMSINKYAFSYCVNLKEIILPTKYVIDEGAFYYCTILESISISKITCFLIVQIFIQ